MVSKAAAQSSSFPTATANASLVSVVLAARTGLFLLSYFATVWLFSLAGQVDAYNSARPWWPVAGLFVNAACLALLALAVRREGKSLASLVGFEWKKLKSDLRSSLWMIAVSLVLAVSANIVFGLPFYGLKTPAAVMSLNALPLWAVIISMAVFPLVNAFVEEMTYNGYVLPRVEGRGAPAWAAVSIVTFFFSLQHIALPFAFDATFLLWRFLSFVPLLLFWVLMYRRVRRLTPLIVTHWFMDVFALLTILFVPVG